MFPPSKLEGNFIQTLVDCKENVINLASELNALIRRAVVLNIGADYLPCFRGQDHRSAFNFFTDDGSDFMSLTRHDIFEAAVAGVRKGNTDFKGVDLKASAVR